MSSSAEAGWYEEFDPSLLDADAALSTGLARRLIGNINHIADQAACRLVEWWPLNPVHTFATPYYEAEETVAATGTFYRVWRSTPFDVRLKPDGSSYRLRTRLHGARSGGAGTVTFHVVVGALGDGRRDVFDTTRSNVAVATSASATHAWLTSSPGAISLESAQASRARATAPTIDAIAGPIGSAPWLRCGAEVWASTTSLSSLARLSGLVVEEYWA